MDVVGEVDLKAFVGGDGRGESVEEGAESWEGAGADFTSWWMSVMLFHRKSRERSFRINKR